MQKIQCNFQATYSSEIWGQCSPMQYNVIQCNAMYPNETQCNALYFSNPMQHNGKALTIRYSAEAKKLTREKYYFPHKQQQWLAMFPSFPRMTWSGRQTDWAHTEAESWRVEHKTTMRWIQPPTMRCEGGRGGTQRLFRKMSSTGKVVDLFQMEWNGMVKFQNC